MKNNTVIQALKLTIVGILSVVSLNANAYTIQNIQVQAKAKSPSAAKEIALTQGRRTAFNTIIQKTVDKREQDRFNHVEDKIIEFLIDGFQVMDEHIGPKNYKATVAFDFNKDRFQKFLRDQAVPFIVPVHKTILILPVLSDGAKTYLFDQNNLWLHMWKTHTFNQALVTFVIPNGDLTDISSIDAEDVLMGASHKLKLLAQRYHVSAIVVPYITIVQEGRHLNIRLDVQEYDSQGIKKNNFIRSHSLSEPLAETSRQAMVQKLLPIAIENIQDFAKAQLGAPKKSLVMYLKIPSRSSQQYYEYLQLLNESTLVQTIQPIELSKTYSTLKITTLYSIDHIAKYFKDRGHRFEISKELMKTDSQGNVFRK